MPTADGTSKPVEVEDGHGDAERLLGVSAGRLVTTPDTEDPAYADGLRLPLGLTSRTQRSAVGANTPTAVNGIQISSVAVQSY